MIKEVTGDILLSKADAIAHGVAPNDDFKQGLALALREQWPALYKDFRHFCHQDHPKTGGIWSWKGAGGPAIVSLFTQEAAAHEHAHPGKASIENVNHALHALKKEIAERKFKSIALTKLATGVGGLDWNQVKPIVEKQLGDAGVTVYVYAHYKKGVQAEEK